MYLNNCLCIFYTVYVLEYIINVNNNLVKIIHKINNMDLSSFFLNWKEKIMEISDRI